MSGEHAVIPRAEFRAEPASHEFGDHAHFRFWQLKDARKLVAHGGSSLSRGINRQQIGLPVRNNSVRLKRAVRLNLRAKSALDDDVGLGEALFDIWLWALTLGRADISVLLRASRASAAARAAGLPRFA